MPRVAAARKQAPPFKVGATAFESCMKNLRGAGPATRALDALKQPKSEIGIFS
jgi:hypothetical protein